MNQQIAPFNYQDEAHVTLSSNFHGDKVPVRLLRNVLEWLIQHGEHADEIKKAVFYGRNIERFEQYVIAGEVSIGNIGNVICPGDAVRGETIFHAIIGKITEATELAQLLFGVLFNGERFDSVNFVEEIGDGQWYDAIGLRAVGESFDCAQRINIEKLRKRFPDKFNEFDANNRDLFAEREILERREARNETVKRAFADAREVTEKLQATTDAQVWAETYVRLFGGDTALMIGWFANAIEVGRSAGYKLGVEESAENGTSGILPPPGYRFPETDGEGHIIEVTSSNGFVPLAPGENDKRQAWSCTIGSIEGVNVPPGGDLPMREAIEKAFVAVTGKEPQAIFSGWGAEFSELQLAVIENRAPKPEA